MSGATSDERRPNVPRASRLESAVESVADIARFLRHETRKLGVLARKGRPGAALGSALELCTGRNPYYERRTAGADRYRRVDLGDRELLVDVDDDGISRTLLSYGVHEYRSSRAFERELERLASEVDGTVTALEAGANVGYFCTLEAAVLGDRARILAVEPIPENLALLERNLAINGFEDVVAVERLAFGDETQPVEMELSTHSNQHRVQTPAADGDDADPSNSTDGGDRRETEAGCGGDGTAGEHPETVAVRQVTGDRYLAERDVDPAEVHAIRLDVEGYERAVLEGLQGVLEAPGPTVLFAELHPLELSTAAVDEIATRLEDGGFEVVSAVRTDAAAGVSDGRRWHGLECGLEEVGDLRRAAAASDHSIELIARK